MAEALAKAEKLLAEINRAERTLTEAKQMFDVAKQNEQFDMEVARNNCALSNRRSLPKMPGLLKALPIIVAVVAALSSATGPGFGRGIAGDIVHAAGFIRFLVVVVIMIAAVAFLAKHFVKPRINGDFMPCPREVGDFIARPRRMEDVVVLNYIPPETEPEVSEVSEVSETTSDFPVPDVVLDNPAPTPDEDEPEISEK